MRKENTMMVVALLVVALFVSNASATVIADYHGYEDAELGSINVDDISEHVTGTVGGYMSHLGVNSNCMYVNTNTYEGNRAAGNKTPALYGFVANSLNSTLSGNQMYWYDTMIYVPHNGLSDPLVGNSSRGLMLQFRYNADISGDIMIKFNFQDNGTLIYNTNVAQAGVAYDLTYDRYIRMTVGINPDPSGDGTVTLDRQVIAYVDGEPAIDLSYVDSKGADFTGSMASAWHVGGEGNVIFHTTDDTWSYMDNSVISDANPIPEPATMSILMLGLPLILRRKKA